MTPRIHVHLGAHKTATTYIQNTLEKNLDRLNAQDIDFIPLQEMREQITVSAVRNDAEGVNQIRTAVHDRLCAKPRTRLLILSDENLVGFPGNLVRDGALYPRISENVASLMEALSDFDCYYYFSVRSYETFLPSMYAEILVHRPFLTFFEYMATVDPETVSWRHVIGRLCGSIAPKRLSLWDYAEFRDRQADVFAALTGGVEDLEPVEGDVRVSPSAKAIAALTALRSTLTDAEIKKLVWPISRALPKNETNPHYNPFNSQTSRRLAARFADDLARIKEELPAIRFL